MWIMSIKRWHVLSITLSKMPFLKFLIFTSLPRVLRTTLWCSQPLTNTRHIYYYYHHHHHLDEEREREGGGRRGDTYLTTITSRKEQHVCIRFCLKQRKNTTETLLNLEVAFGELIMGIMQLLGWFCTFTSGMTPDEDGEHSGHPSVSTID